MTGQEKAFPCRIGTGFDVHRMTEGRKCMLGGVEIPSSKGPVGHSDGDALLHALADALLGAAGLDDLGSLFPDSDPKWKDASSRELLIEVYARVKKAGFQLVNADLILVAEQPKLAPHRSAIRDSISSLLGVPSSCVNLKGKTAEGLGAIGSGESIAAFATVLVCR